MNNPVFQNLDPLKQELMRTAFERTRGKTGRNLAPVMMSLITQANQKGIRFSEEEMTLILQFLKEGKSQEEQARIDQMVAFVNAAWKKRM
ncbi:MAG: hypothetical protein ACLRLT_00770 [Sellimonas intestinalis]|nr:hypothetical protein [Sellimonas intestinalis]MBS6924264.1 hypothetical protein [Lachnospiraceae bacterium]MBA2213812.1 hypothetical protein [Sellimonas intestinalis]MCG4596512.1 hypothetical protein [Sellimonas intestinalis]UOX61808.1 hypothetical protein K5I26_11425 [Sellimonas intestinalis]HJE99990.1 hypothetical protein [Sellimonas intestinalis]